MLKLIISGRCLIGMIVLFFLQSCNNNASKEAEQNKSTADTITMSKADTSVMATTKVTADKAMISMNGFLNRLYIDAATFTTSQKRIVFRFYSITPDSLTLRGWINDGNKFPNNPDIKLLIGKPSLISFGTGTYFGNMVLTSPDHKAINIQARAFKYVVFIPLNPSGSALPGQITYDIELTNDDPATVPLAEKVIPTNRMLNPSPPRNPG